MAANSGSAPAWLFSFLDLAFLILIAVLLTADGEPEDAPDLAAIPLPEIQRSSTEPLARSSATPWQLRVHPRAGESSEAPFTLSLASDEAAGDATAYVASSELAERLRALAGAGATKPFLAPHRDSRSEDFLTALGFVQEYWPQRHAAAVIPRSELPAVSAGVEAPGAIDEPSGEEAQL